MDMVSYLLLFHMLLSQLGQKSEEGNCSVMCNTVGKNKEASEILMIFWKVVKHNAEQQNHQHTLEPVLEPSQAALVASPAGWRLPHNKQPQYKQLKTNLSKLTHFSLLVFNKCVKLQNQWFSNTFSKSAIGAVCFHWRAEGSASWLLTGVQAAPTCFSLISVGFVQIDGVSG